MSDRIPHSSMLDKLAVPTCRAECAMGNIRVRGARVYNDIPLDIRESNSIHVFKKNLLKGNPLKSKFV